MDGKMNRPAVDLELFTLDHPTAQARRRLPGESTWKLSFTLSDGKTLILNFGETTRNRLFASMVEEDVKDAKEATIN